jgi:hypothetical protein
MFIVDADRRNAVNVDNVISIGIEGRRIVAVTRVDDIILGQYHEDYRANEVYAEMLKWIFPPLTINASRGGIDADKIKDFDKDAFLCRKVEYADIKTADGCWTYYMPEE